MNKQINTTTIRKFPVARVTSSPVLSARGQSIPDQSPINPQILPASLGNLVVNSESSHNQRFSVLEIRDKLKKYQKSSQVKSCGTDLGCNPVVRQSGQLVLTQSSCQSVHCPKCRIKIMNSRKSEIQFLIDSFLADNPAGSIKMLTLTFPHYKKNRGTNWQ